VQRLLRARNAEEARGAHGAQCEIATKDPTLVNDPTKAKFKLRAVEQDGSTRLFTLQVRESL
jgi:hypothetical protein